MSEGVKRQIVLGAGASDGFPLGSELLKILKKDVKNYIEEFILPKSEVFILSKSDSKPAYEYYQKEIIKINLDGISDEFKEFCQQVLILLQNLEKSSATSIDYFASRISDKYHQAIAKALIRNIIQSYNTKIEETWYGNLLPIYFPDYVEGDKVRNTIDAIIQKSKEIQIITFNYDLSLEKFLFDFLKNNVFPIESDYAESKLKDEYKEAINTAKAKIFQTIKHVYGSIEDPINCNFEEIHQENFSDNFFKILTNAHKDFIEFAKNPDESKVNILRLIGEERKEIPQLQKCDYLYILGFGFDPINVEKININFQYYEKMCYLTNYKDNQRIKRVALNRLTKRSANFIYPIISTKEIKEALINDFSLNEESYWFDYNVGDRDHSSISPYYSYKKFE